MVSLLKAWKLTVVGIECDDAVFSRAWKVTVVGIECNGVAFFDILSGRSTLEIVLSRNFSSSANKMTNCILVDIV